ncbi:MAG TPA: nucleotidyltransferase domain-containing protein [Chitinispirillaceae bacterium]|nr:nucleotidyltransferase domain-containing protein [Chitinispirillaceae bacterium]
MVTAEKIKTAVSVLAQESSPEMIILFGSWARNEARADSDVDFLVVTKNSTENRFRVATRLRRSLSPLKIPVDILVHDSSTIDEWADVPGTLVHTIMTEGKIVYEKST